MNAHFLDERNLKNYTSDHPCASLSNEYCILKMMGNIGTVKETICQCLHPGKNYVLGRLTE